MPLESASYIDGLNPSYPGATDQVQQGDDHIRLLKAVIKSTFPNITAPVTKTAAELNNPPSSVPVGSILMWYGTSGTVPASYAICDGTLANKSDGTGTIQTPDLRSKIPMGAGATVAQGATAGSLTDTAVSTTAGAHTHGIGSHTHPVTLSGTTGATNGAGTLSTTTGQFDDSAGSPAPALISASITGATHTHTVSLTGNTGAASGAATDSNGDHSHTVTVDTLPPVYGIHFIIKL